MQAVERLKRDHTLLRSKLDVVEVALRMVPPPGSSAEGGPREARGPSEPESGGGMGPGVLYVLREVCLTLARQLRDHIKREEELVVACRHALSPPGLAALAVAHRYEPAHLRAINRLFVEEPSHTLERIRPALSAVLQGLRRHMAEEEAELFPLLERVLSARESAHASVEEASGWHLHECMTVNRVVHDYPTTKEVFERSFIDVSMEGCYCLDEVAWRHGMESRELLEQLEQVIPPGVARASGLEKKREPCECR